MIKMSFVEIAKKDELDNNEMKSTKLNGKEFLIAKIGHQFYVTDNRLPSYGWRSFAG